jgi:magnesium chelatase family protein
MLIVGPPGAGKTLLARAYHRVLKLARTIADLAEREGIEPGHLAEALQYWPNLVG